ncbi:MAG: serine/threonine-protein kinase [Pirellulales bacterium]
MNLPVRELDEAEPRAAKIKFTYASGARPLEGYTIKRGVGRGGFGEVYFATSDAGKEVALKLIRRNLDVELRGVTQCLNLKHPNLIALYDIRSDEMGDQWVVMEYVSGESLEDVIERNPSGMPIEEALWWMRGVCGGVAYLHDHGIVHRDLKPGNIFSDEGTVKIGDYGLAKFISCSRRSGQTESVGTVHYMAPEIANGRYGREIDTYALGIILFEMLTGRVPFEGESVGEVLMKHLTAEPDLTALAEPYRDIVRRALAKDPEVRINSVEEMMSLLPGGEAIPPRLTVSSPSKPAAAFPTNATLRDAAHWVRAADERAARTFRGDSNEEPIWKAIRENFTGERLKNMHPLKKAILIFVLVALFFWYSDTVFSLIIPVLICYFIYHAIWTNWVQPESSGEAASAAAEATAQAAASSVDEHTIAWPAKGAAADAARPNKADRRRRVRPTWRDRAQRELAAKPLREKLSELLGSMLLAAIFAAVAACVAPLIFGGQPNSERMAAYLWLATIGTLGSWAILVPSKLVEGKLEDQVPMRIVLLSLGLTVGLAGWAIGDALLLHTPGWGEPVDVGHGLLSHEMLGWPATDGGANPSPAVYLAYFAFMFLVPRWWRQTEYTRSARLSLWWVIVCVGWAWLLHIFWWFPQPTGMLAAAIIAIATQLASPWMPPSRRRELAAQIEGGVV